MARDLTLKIGGEGGEGVISAGDFLMRSATRVGMEVVTFKSFPAEIKGGYALSQVRVSDEEILSQGDSFHILLAFNGEAFEVNKSLLRPGTVCVYDSGPEADFEPEDIEGVTMYPVPMSGIAKKELGAYITKNMVALGAASELFKIPMSSLKDSVKEKFSKKGEKIVDLNYKALEAGAQYVRENIKKTDKYIFPEARKSRDVIVIEGNEAIALGATMAGCSYYGAYPITPATTVGNYLSEMILGTGGYVYQSEDEISALGTCLGASFAGAKALSATSGPGVSLMNELIGLGVMAELPVVIVNVQRGGPSTGMPTRHDQGDLMQAIYGSHGDSPKIVLAPSNVKENLYLTIDAFNLAERYQSPVLLLTDASLALRVEAIDRPDMSKIKIEHRVVGRNGRGENARGDNGAFLRYLDTEDGISPMGIPGNSGESYAATGLEHAENSGPRTNPDTRTKMTEKRWRKFDNIEDEYEGAVVKDEQDGARVGVMSWGLTQSIASEAVARLRVGGEKVSALYPKLLWPLPKKAIESFASKLDKIVIPEANFQGQFARLVKSMLPLHEKIETLNVYRGEPFIPKEIEECLRGLLQKVKV